MVAYGYAADRKAERAQADLGDFTAALAAHARDSWVNDAPFDFELIYNWDAIAETRWDLSYRGDPVGATRATNWKT